jgi:hypothetical protein
MIRTRLFFSSVTVKTCVGVMARRANSSGLNLIIADNHVPPRSKLGDLLVQFLGDAPDAIENCKARLHLDDAGPCFVAPLSKARWVEKVI